MPTNYDPANRVAFRKISDDDLRAKAAALPDSGLEIERDVISWREKMLTDQRFANLLELADIVAGFDADGIEAFRRLGTDEQRPLRDFFRNANPETLRWLSRADETTVKQIETAIKYLVGDDPKKPKTEKIDAVILFFSNMEFTSKWLMKGIGIFAATVTFFILVYNGLKK